MDSELNGFAADEGTGVSDTGAVEGESSAIEQDASTTETTQETPEQKASGGTPAEPRLVPQTDLDKMRSTYDRRISELDRQNQQYQQGLQNMEAALLEMRWQGLDPEAAAAEKAEYARVVQQRAAEAAKSELSQREAALNELAKPLFAQQLSQQYGVPVDVLLRFNDADSMQVAAQSLSVQKNANKLQERKASGVDRMEGAGSHGGPAWGDKRGEDLLNWYFRNRKSS